MGKSDPKVPEDIMYRHFRRRKGMQKLVFVIGATASGKTHFIQEKFKDKNVEILNIYDYQQKAYDEVSINGKIPFGVEFRCLMNANNWLLQDIKEKLLQGKSLVVEQTFYKAKRRLSYIDEIRKVCSVFIECYMMNPGDVLWKSNLKKRGLLHNFEGYKEMFLQIDFPNPAERIDQIYEVVDGEIHLRMEEAKPEILEEARKELKEEAERIFKEEEEQRKRKELLESMNHRSFWHYCEVCGKKEYITAKEAFEQGWDYPPNIGHFGLLGPRTCGDCHLVDTLYWKITTQKTIPIVLESELTLEEKETWRRMKAEPESLLEEMEEASQ